MDGFHLVQHLEEALLRGLPSPEHGKAAHLSEVVGTLNLLRLIVDDDHVVKKVNLGLEVRQVDAGRWELHCWRLRSVLALGRGDLGWWLLGHLNLRQFI